MGLLQLKFLVQRMPLTMDDLSRQPLTWKFLFSYARGVLLDSRPRMNWVCLGASVAGNVLSWGCYVMNHSLQSLSMHLVRGGAIMCNDMQVALGQFMASWPPSSNQIWFGYFSPLKVILGAKVTNTMPHPTYFNVDDDGRLWHVLFASDLWMCANVSTIRVVAQS